MPGGWSSVKGSNHMCLPSAYSIDLDVCHWRQTGRTFSLAVHNYFCVILFIFHYTLS